MSSADALASVSVTIGHVVDLDRLDDPAGHARRHDVEVLVDLLVELDQAPLAVLAHVVADGDDRLVLAAHRVDVLDAVDLVEDLLQRRGDQLLDFRRRVAGEVDVHVGQRHDDLRVFLARRQPQRRQADDRGQQDQDEREVRLQEDLHDPVREVVFLRCGNAGMLSHGSPPAMVDAGLATGMRAACSGVHGTTTCSPSRKPESTSTGRAACHPGPSRRPVRIARALDRLAALHDVDQFQLADVAARPAAE